MKTPAEQAEAFAQKKRKHYMAQYREEHREEIRAKRKDYYIRSKLAKHKEDNNGERQRPEIGTEGDG